MRRGTAVTAGSTGAAGRIICHALLAAAAMTALPVRGAAQVPWESPQMIAPGAPRGTALMFVDYGLRPNDGTGLLLTYRPAAVPEGVGMRLAGTMPGSDRVRISGGADITLPMFARTVSFPLDVVWTSGLGAGYGDYWSVALPVGVAAGRTFAGSSLALGPWTAVRVVMEGYFGADHPEETFALLLGTELGADVWLTGRAGIRLRTAVALGDRRALAVGLHIGGSGPRAMAAHRTQ